MFDGSRLTLGGRLAKSTSSVWSTALENLDPSGAQSIRKSSVNQTGHRINDHIPNNLSILSTTITLKGLLLLSANTLLMAATF